MNFYIPRPICNEFPFSNDIELCWWSLIRHRIRPLGERGLISFAQSVVRVSFQIPNSGSATSISQEVILDQVYCEIKNKTKLAGQVLPTHSRHKSVHWAAQYEYWLGNCPVHTTVRLFQRIATLPGPGGCKQCHMVFTMFTSRCLCQKFQHIKNDHLNMYDVYRKIVSGHPQRGWLAFDI